MKRTQVVSIVLCSLLAISGPALFSADWPYPFKESSLGGGVKSEKGKPLEGIVVRAKREKSHVAYSVISDVQGQFRFPLLEAGRYFVETARADGLEPGRQNVEIRRNQESRVDFSLGPAKEMIQQISAADWLENLPGTPEQVMQIQRRCVTCHNLYTVMKFRFDKESWAKIIRIMGRVHGTGGPKIPEYYDGLGELFSSSSWKEEEVQQIAEYLAKVQGPEPVNLSNAKILPRPTGRSTRVLFTEYDIPYDQAEPHDMGIDRFGTVWWTDWRWPYLGRLNPDTGEMKFWEAPKTPGKPDAHPGTFKVAFDEEDNPWTAITWTAGLAKFDRKAEKFTATWAFPDRGPRQITLATGFNPDLARGRIWFGTSDEANDADAIAFYVPKTGQFTLYDPPPGENGSRDAYGRVIDSKGNAYLLKSGHAAIDRIDGETGEFTRYVTPTPNSFPRRGDPDSEDRIWFAEWNADQIGVLDPKTGKITEYKLNAPRARPYAVKPDLKTGLIWAALFLKDRVASLDPKTGEIREYLLPTKDSQVRMLEPYSAGDHSVVWFGSLPEYENGKIVKLEVW